MSTYWNILHTTFFSGWQMCIIHSFCVLCAFMPDAEFTPFISFVVVVIVVGTIRKSVNDLMAHYSSFMHAKYIHFLHMNYDCLSFDKNAKCRRINHKFNLALKDAFQHILSLYNTFFFLFKSIFTRHYYSAIKLISNFFSRFFVAFFLKIDFKHVTSSDVLTFSLSHAFYCKWIFDFLSKRLTTKFTHRRRNETKIIRNRFVKTHCRFQLEK